MDFTALESFEHVQVVLAFVVPGVIIMVVRAQFVAGHVHSASSHYVYYVTVSVIYHGLVFPAVEPFLPESVGSENHRAWLVYLVVLPAMVGIVLGAAVRWRWPRIWLNKIGINPVHPIQTAWDWKLGYIDRHWI